MPRYFLRLSFDGTRYHGWQRQPGAMTVQQALEEALGTLTRAPGGIVAVTGAGRTDAGVHAAMMPAHIDLPSEPADIGAFIRSLNSLVGKDIAIHEMVRVADDAHARFDAVSRTYHYYVTLRKNPFASQYSWRCSSGLDFEAMNRAARLLLGRQDFGSFAKLHSDAKTNICNVTRAEWVAVPGYDMADAMMFVITADRFLRNMVRAVVGTLVEVGRGKLDTEGFRRVIESGDRCAAGTSMPAQGLFLHHVGYPYLPW